MSQWHFHPFQPLCARLVLLVLCGSQTAAAGPPQVDLTDLKTVAESSDFQATSRSREVAEFVDECAQASHVSKIQYGHSVEGRPLVAAVVANPPLEKGDSADERLRILLLGNIHSGECAGKEALLAMLRELAVDASHPWLADSVIIIAPNYNSDANDRVGLNHRRGQAGPDAGMGVRENAQQLDLNRDFVKLESPEARGLVALIDTFDPHMFIDCHTTNGSLHQYALTYDIPHNPTAPRAVRDYLRNNMMPAVTRELRQAGTKTFYYGNFSGDKSRWITYGHEPRYSTEYVGLRGRLGILSEAYSYASYQQRIAASEAFVRQCINHVLADADAVRQLLHDVRNQNVARATSAPGETLIHLQSELAEFPDKVTIEAFQDDQPKNFEVTFVGDFRPTTTVEMPFWYAIPQQMSLAAERLQMHGIQIRHLTEDLKVDQATIYTPTAIRRGNRVFQGHQMVTVEAGSRRESITLPKGTFVVSTAQPLGRLAAYMLEPETNEGLVTWNFLDSWLATGEDYPIIRIEQPVPLQTALVDKIAPGELLNLTDIFGPDRMEFADVSLNDINWTEDGTAWVQQKNGRPVVVNAETGAEDRLVPALDRTTLATAFDSIEGVSGADIREMLTNNLQLRGPDQRLFLLENDGRTFILDVASNSVIELGDSDQPAELAEIDPTGQRVAWVMANNLYWTADISQVAVALTDDGSPDILNGKLDWVYQEELYGRGKFKAFWWSPDGHSIAWLRTDEGPVQKYTVTDHLPVRGRLEVTAYPKAGDPLPRVTVHVYDSQQNRQTDFPEPAAPVGELQELLVSRVTWDGSSGTLLVQLQNRIQSWLDLCRYDPQQGTVTRLFRDQTPAWIVTPGDPVILQDGSFLWLSPRSGFNSIWHYSAAGEVIRQLTTDPWEVRTLLGCDESTATVYFTGSPETPTRIVPMSIDLQGGNPVRLTGESGSQSVKFNGDWSWFLCQSSTVTDPDSISLHRASGERVRMVVPNLDDRLRHLRITDPEFLSIPLSGDAGPGDELDALLIKPVDFDPARQYPVVVHVYGGPQTPRVRDRFDGRRYLWHQYLAQQGFVVFLVDNRSASYRSVRQAWPIYKNLAEHELEDVESAVTWLKNQPWVDGNRVGLWGWSYGGYMTAYALTHSKTFAAGIAGAPVTDWKNYDAIYTERFMDTPQNNPTGYESSSVLPAAGNLHGQLLIIHGTIDDNVHVSNTLQLVEAFQQAGQNFDLMLYPNNRHSVSDPGQQLHLYRLMTQFLQDNL